MVYKIQILILLPRGISLTFVSSNQNHNNPMTTLLPCISNFNHMKSSILRTIFLFCLSLLWFQAGAQNCNPDTVAPIANCVSNLTVHLDYLGAATVTAANLDNGSSDACCLAGLSVRRTVDGPCDGDNLPDNFTPTVQFCCADGGSSVSVTLRATDCSGNTGDCTAQVTVVNDQPPISICDASTIVAIGFDDPNDCYLTSDSCHAAAVIWTKAQAFDGGSNDNCNPVKLTVRRKAPYSNFILGLNQINGHPDCSDVFPDVPSEFERAISERDSIKFYADEVGTNQFVILRAYKLDSDGNIMYNQSGLPIYNECYSQVTVADKVKPICIPPANVTITCETFDPSLLAYGIAQISDNCCLDQSKSYLNQCGLTHTVNYSSFDSICSRGTILRTFHAYDCHGLSDACTQRIVVNYKQDYFIHFPDDRIITNSLGNTGSYGSPTFGGQDCELLGVSYQDYLIPLATNTLRIERTWTIINWCHYVPNLPLIEVPNPAPVANPNSPANLPGPIVSAAGTAVPWTPTTTKIRPTDASPTHYSDFYDPNANGYKYKQIIDLRDTTLPAVTGKVFTDTLSNCQYDAGEPYLKNWKVEVVGSITHNTYHTTTDNTGTYIQAILPQDTLVEVSLEVPINYGQGCPSVYMVHPNIPGQTQDIATYLDDQCPLLAVDLSTAGLRRCFQNRYVVNACNLGTQTVSGVHVEVHLDNFMQFQSSDIPGTDLGNNTYSFQLDTLLKGQCKQFGIDFILSCDAALGATHCTEAHVFPDSLCGGNAAWSKANVQVSGYCDGDSIRMAIKNKGTGDMKQTLDFVVVEDVIMYEQGHFKLNAGAQLNVTLPANQSTWHLQAQQEPGHPWGGPETVSVEGCGGGINQPGLVTQLPFNDPNPFIATDCRENVGSFDPNEKLAFPKGFGPNHLIEANSGIDYMIRFQNTGTDTAFTVIVYDTLSSHLDAVKARPGTSSHPYSFALLDNNVLRFRFDNIRLPDSTVNEPASHGYIKFHVDQKPDNPDGTHIENRAAIMFDYNQPVMTNTVFHNVGHDFILVSVDPGLAASAIRVYPNPASESVIFDLPAAGGLFELTGVSGQVFRSEQITQPSYRFQRNQLAAGMYFYSITMPNQTIYRGKIILK
jgi:uncharacterized repeat protein (TIGR01451 family)